MSPPLFCDVQGPLISSGRALRLLTLRIPVVAMIFIGSSILHVNVLLISTSKGSVSDGILPFTSFTSANMIKLHGEVPTTLSDIHALSREHGMSRACPI